MSDTTPTNAAGVFLNTDGTHAYLYNRNGTFIADHALADGIVAVFAVDIDRARAAVIAWLDTIGYRIPADDSGWAELPQGHLRAVEYVGPVAFDWERGDRAGQYNGFHDAGHRATVHRTREGMIGANETMYVVRVDGRHITNEGRIIDAKLAADRELRRIIDIRPGDPEEPANVDGPRATTV